MHNYVINFFGYIVVPANLQNGKTDIDEIFTGS